MKDLEKPAEGELLARLTAFPSLAGIPEPELRWIIRACTLTAYEVGDVIAEPTSPMDQLWIVLEGRAAIFVDRGAGPRRAAEWGPGAVTGLLPYSRMTTPPGTSRVLEPLMVLRMPGSALPDLIRECPVFTALTVHIMLDRARSFNAADLHDEKMVSLGRLSAGLAHELNNPASAAASEARMLGTEILAAEAAARALGGAGLTPDQVATVERVRDACLGSYSGPPLSAADRLNREEDITSWLDAHDADPEYGPQLSETPVSIESLDLLAHTLPPDALDLTLRWIATGCAVRALAKDIEKSAKRIHDLVSSVKRFSYMDRSLALGPVDLAQGLADTVAVLRSKAREKSLEVDLDVERDLPALTGNGGELNQVWLNLIDNALAASPEAGTVQVQARRESDWIVVRVVDQGPGVPQSIKDNIFDPFFTTKPPGQGTGQGLDIARRLVKQHDGEIDVRSEPGRTEFSVRLPLRELTTVVPL
jgi:signal transduction histidine kinase